MCNMTIEHRVVNEYFETTGAEILTVETFILPSFPPPTAFTADYRRLAYLGLNEHHTKFEVDYTEAR